MDTLLYDFARQGLGYLISTLLAFVVIWQQKRIDAKDKQITELQDKRIFDTNQYTATYTSVIKEMVEGVRDNLAAVNLLQRSMDAIAQALNNLSRK